MSQKIKLQTAQKVLQCAKSTNKNIEINMSTLSSAQKQMCLKLLASSNINFEEDRNQNCFEAELRIDPAKLTDQFTVEEKQVPQEPKVSPIKKRQHVTKQQQQKYMNAKQNIAISGNKRKSTIIKQQQITKPTQTTKQSIINHAIYTNSRKPLSKTVKVNTLTQIQRLHPYVQLYIYPKKMSFQSLIELIEEIYELYWCVEVQGKPLAKVKKEMMNLKGGIGIENEANNRSRRQPVINNDNRSVSSKSMSNAKYNPIRQSQPQNNTNDESTIPTNHNPMSLQQIQSKQPFAKWVYENFITMNKQKMKSQQLLVNLIESLNHFSFKHLGVQIFVNFLSGAYSLDVLNYFLVIRALLQQLSGEKVIEKVSSYGSRQGVMYKMKLNPYMKEIQQQRVYDFLQVCFQGSKQQQTIDQIFQQMTQQMFFEQKKRKNFIYYFDMVDILIREFMKVQTTMNNTTTNLQLSVTQTHQQSEQFGDLLSYYENGNGEQKEIELTFQVKQAQNQEQQQQFVINGSQVDFDRYLPYKNNNTQSEIMIDDDYDHRMLSQSMSKQKQMKKKQDFYDIIVEKIYAKYKSLCRQFSTLSSQQENSQKSQQKRQSKQIIDTLIQAVMKHDKIAWISMLKQKFNIKQNKEAYQLHFIQQLQKNYQQIKNANFVSNQFIKKILTASYLRQTILMQSGIGLKNL